jgi:hypothetical protein
MLLIASRKATEFVGAGFTARRPSIDSPTDPRAHGASDEPTPSISHATATLVSEASVS